MKTNLNLEKTFKATSGILPFVLVLALLGGSVAGIVLFKNALFSIGIAVAVLMCLGFVVVAPNYATVLTFLGNYKGTVRENGFWWVNPLYSKKSISLRARNLEREPVKVNDKLGNPIMIGVVLVWRVENTYKAAFEVDSYENYVRIQSESAIRQLATHFAYDKFDDEENEISLRDGGEEVNHILEETLRSRLQFAGISVVEARIAYLAYASEIAGAMLQRQQATAIIAARKKIVEGAVSMVQMALHSLSDQNIVHLDDAKKAAMVTNLMVVLCSDRAATPVVNAGNSE